MSSPLISSGWCESTQNIPPVKPRSRSFDDAKYEPTSTGKRWVLVKGLEGGIRRFKGKFGRKRVLPLDFEENVDIFAKKTHKKRIAFLVMVWVGLLVL